MILVEDADRSGFWARHVWHPVWCWELTFQIYSLVGCKRDDVRKFLPRMMVCQFARASRLNGDMLDGDPRYTKVVRSPGGSRDGSTVRESSLQQSMPRRNREFGGVRC